MGAKGMKTQAQLDTLIRKAAGKNAVEAMVKETRKTQVYQLSNGQLLAINKLSGSTVVYNGN
jgi:hypothetical protein